MKRSRNENSSLLKKHHFDDDSEIGKHLTKKYTSKLKQEDALIIYEAHQIIGDKWELMEKLFQPLKADQLKDIIKYTEENRFHVM